ncbi:hypothetical protein [Chitinophaga barathri]|uniref:hypothetical protein n=1 Tax=Chitinophaga barathri TaxID=1647451 RepID=UPI0013C3F787|nr:hypothetical protein [Chitinophaga barathri]
MLIAAAELEHKLKQPEKSVAAWQVPQPLAPLLDEVVRDTASGKKISHAITIQIKTA